MLRIGNYSAAMQIIEPIEQLFGSDQAKSLTHWATSALVKYRVAYQGGETILGKKDDKWEIAYYYMTWIE